jgi:hypothetical protein
MHGFEEEVRRSNANIDFNHGKRLTLPQAKNSTSIYSTTLT